MGPAGPFSRGLPTGVCNEMNHAVFLALGQCHMDLLIGPVNIVLGTEGNDLFNGNAAFVGLLHLLDIGGKGP